MRPVTIAALTLAVLISTVAAPASAGIVPRDGTWGGFLASHACEPDGCEDMVEVGQFKLRRNEVSAMKYMVVVTCLNRESGDYYDRSFMGGAAFPADQRIGRDLTLTATYDETSDTRDAEVRTVVDFRGRRAKLLVRLQINGEVERCTGNTTIALRRGERRRPRP